MVHTSMPIITAIVALSAAAPIFAAPLNPRIDSGFSSVNNRAPTDAEQAHAAPADSPIGDVTAINPLSHHLATRGAEVEAGAKTGTAKYGPITQGLLGRTVLAAISSILRREPEFADSFSRELATELKARSAISGAAVTNNLIQHLNRAGGTPVAEESAGPADSSSSESGASDTPATSVSEWGDWSDDEPGPPPPHFPLPPAPPNTPEPPDTPEGSGSGGESSSPAPQNTPEGSGGSPSTGILSNSVKTAVAKVATGGFNTGANIGKVLKNLRDLDADTLHLLGRNLEDLFPRSFGIDELD